jgi:diguanylate cyclase (GGDEF)-like protein
MTSLHRRAEAALRESEERFRVALRNSPIVVFNQDRELKYTWINGPVLAWAEQEWLGRTDLEIVGGEEGARLTEIKVSVLRSGEPARSEVSVTFKNEKYFYDLTIEPLWGREKEIVGITCAAVDITLLKRAQLERERLLAELQTALARNEYLAFHDTLTGVPNRRLLEDRFQQALARADRQGAKTAVLVLDLDDFKTINDTFGHKFGDLVLKDVAVQLTGRLRASDTLARTGVDEFTVLADVADKSAAQALASALMFVFAHPFEVKDKSVVVGASIGVALYPDDGRGADELLSVADRMMYVVKRTKKNSTSIV